MRYLIRFLCPTILSDFLFDFFCSIFFPTSCSILCPTILSDYFVRIYLFDFLSGFAVWFFVPIYCPMSCSISLCDFLSDYIFRFFVRIFLSDFCVLFFCPIFCFILCPIFCLICLSDVSAFDMPMIFHSHANKAHFHKKAWALGLILKVRVFGTRKWPIGSKSFTVYSSFQQIGQRIERFIACSRGLKADTTRDFAPGACCRGTLREQSSSVCTNDFMGILHPREQNFHPAKCSTIFNRLNIWEQAPGANWANLKTLPRVYSWHVQNEPGACSRSKTLRVYRP